MQRAVPKPFSSTTVTAVKAALSMTAVKDGLSMKRKMKLEKNFYSSKKLVIKYATCYGKNVNIGLAKKILI